MNAHDTAPEPDLLSSLAKRHGGFVRRIRNGGGGLGWQLTILGAMPTGHVKELKRDGYHYAGKSWVRWDRETGQ